MGAEGVGRRKRRRKIVVRKRTLPKVFTCPVCGTASVAVKIRTVSYTHLTLPTTERV